MLGKCTPWNKSCPPAPSMSSFSSSCVVETMVSDHPFLVGSHDIGFPKFPKNDGVTHHQIIQVIRSFYWRPLENGDLGYTHFSESPHFLSRIFQNRRFCSPRMRLQPLQCHWEAAACLSPVKRSCGKSLLLYTTGWGPPDMFVGL